LQVTEKKKEKRGKQQTTSDSMGQTGRERMGHFKETYNKTSPGLEKRGNNERGWPKYPKGREKIKLNLAGASWATRKQLGKKQKKEKRKDIKKGQKMNKRSFQERVGKKDVGW